MEYSSSVDLRGVAFVASCVVACSCQALLDFEGSAATASSDAGVPDAASGDALVPDALTTDAAPLVPGSARKLRTVGAGVTGIAVHGGTLAWITRDTINIAPTEDGDAGASTQVPPCSDMTAEFPLVGPVVQGQTFAVACGHGPDGFLSYYSVAADGSSVLHKPYSSISNVLAIAGSAVGVAAVFSPINESGQCHLLMGDSTSYMTCPSAHAIAANALAAYVVDAAGTLERVDWSGTPPKALGTPQPGVLSMAANDTDVFWAGPSSVGRAPVSPSSDSATLVERTTTSATAIAVDGAKVVLLRDDRVWLTNPSFDSPIEVSGAGTPARLIAVDTSGVYWVAGDAVWVSPF